MKHIFIPFILIFVLISCKNLFKDDEELSFEKTPNTSNKIRLDGYYFHDIKSEGTGVNIFYQNGTVFFSGRLESLESFENKIITGDVVGKSKSQWGLYLLNADTILTNGLALLSGTYHYTETFSKYLILNDTTILFKETKFSNGNIDSYNDTLHFKQFNPKPDSTNVFIK